MQEVTGKRFARAGGVQVALDRLVLAATRLRVPDGVGGNDLDHPATNRARYLIECEPERHWRLDELARAAGGSPGAPPPFFSRRFGPPPRGGPLENTHPTPLSPLPPT